MDYDYKRNLLRYDIDEKLTKGKHTFTLKVTDNVNNKKVYTADFTYWDYFQQNSAYNLLFDHKLDGKLIIARF